MSKSELSEMSYWTELCLKLRMSEEGIVAFFAKNPVEKAEFLIAMFSANQDIREKAAILSILSKFGDVEIAGNFLADVLQSDCDRLKFRASVVGEFSKFDNHLHLRDAIRAHLQGRTPAEVWIRNAFPDGCCPLKNKAAPLSEKPPAETKTRRRDRTSPNILSFRKRNNN